MPLNNDNDYRQICLRLAKLLQSAGIIDDNNEGSISQILLETFSYEMALFYKILDKANDAGFIDTAKGIALDNVVRILGIERKRSGVLSGEISFSRESPSDNDIVIPAGMLITCPSEINKSDTIPLMETMEEVILHAGALKVIAAIQEVTGSEIKQDGTCPSIPPDTLTIMVRPLMGIEKVCNEKPVQRSGLDENDDHLKARAMSFLNKKQTCTIDALEDAVRSYGIRSVKIVEDETTPGIVTVIIGDADLKPDIKKNIVAVLRNVKSAGIYLNIEFTEEIKCKLTITVTLNEDEKKFNDNEFLLLENESVSKIEEYITNLSPGIEPSRDKIKSILFKNDSVVKSEIDIILIDQTGNPIKKLLSSLQKVTISKDVITVKRNIPPCIQMDVTVTTKTVINNEMKTEIKASIQKLIDNERIGSLDSYKVSFKNFKEKIKGNTDLTLVKITLTHIATGDIEMLLNDQFSEPISNDTKLFIGSVLKA